ncbi:hypothetical protein ACFFOS_01800 [Nocardioides kongjuensis]|uniref:Uncharacterized protein n=1 Tax=Nocardioides kongjuensis TaxID=349522 RepID=A0A852REJ2_9ACTN|nr:hypothetical protein [Nocardioides kongjuensis]NYD29655.1 hypothetical protein [Nocardioides kongjuensis]
MRPTWLGACTLAEAVGITAAAGAARLATWLTDVRDVAPGWGLAVVVAGGLVEGTSLGVLQSVVLRRRLGDAAARRWTTATVLVAGLAWAAGSAPATLAGPGGGTPPPLLLVVAGGAALGATTGALLGTAQAAAVRRQAARPWRWVASSTVGWTVAMPVIFLGAGLPAADWPTPLVVALGTVTGTAAGAVLGVLTRRGAAALTDVAAESGRPKVPSVRAIRP